MKIKTPFWWYFYFCIFAFHTGINLFRTLHPSSDIYQYYHVLMAFNVFYSYFNALAISSSLLDCLTLIPLFLRLQRLPLLNPWIWKTMFTLRAAFNITGHNFEWQTIKAYLLTDKTLAVSFIYMTAILILPSYILTFQYAFRRDMLAKD